MVQFVQPTPGYRRLSMKVFVSLTIVVCVSLLAGLSPSNCATAIAAEPPNVLDVPQLLQQQMVENVKGVELLRSGEYARAKLVFRQCVLRIPHDMSAVYNLACAHALLGQKEDAFEMLRAAIKLGFRSKQQLNFDNDLNSLRELPEFAEILKACDEPAPAKSPGWNYSIKIAQIENNAFTIDNTNMVWNLQSRVMQVFMDVGDCGKERLVSGAADGWGDSILSWYSAGKAAGNVGDLYDNHDRGHSALSLSKFPQLTPIRFGPEVQKRQFDHGPQRLFLFVDAKPEAKPDAKPEVKPDDKPEAQPGANPGANPGAKPDGKPDDKNGRQAADKSASEGVVQVDSTLRVSRTIVLGNSSTALTGSAFWRSMPRLILNSQGGAELLTQHYMNNHIYVYPEHRDHDPGHDESAGWGDVYTANTPFYFISQGSSGSDQPFLEALAATLAAFQPDTKLRLKQTGLMASTLQMILRRCNQPIKSDEDYLSGLAHPTVFDGTQVDPTRMVQMAQDMKATEVPPVTILKLQHEKLGDPQRDYFDSMPSEVALTTPFAIARICNSTQYWREMVVTPAGSADVNKRPLSYKWVLLRGDPDRVSMEPVASDPAARRLKIGYHPRRPVQSGSALESNRVDIGVFAFNGVYYSAPAFISFYFPDNEVRVYDDQQRIASVDYASAGKNYVDPSVVAERNWRDEYHYDQQGSLSGWTRIRGDQKEEFNADGQLLVGNQDGKPPQAVKVVYQRSNYPDGRPYISQKTSE
ncbi:MAG: hypothetical protein IT423_07530 [Pirellulaceae bacterium]|nr:hypothetical protein [Pirellulaceae bacterium]